MRVGCRSAHALGHGRWGAVHTRGPLQPPELWQPPELTPQERAGREQARAEQERARVERAQAERERRTRAIENAGKTARNRKTAIAQVREPGYQAGTFRRQRQRRGR
jgi:hypothetical protein